MVKVEHNDPVEDKERLEEIARLGLHLEWAADEVLDSLVQKASKEFNLPTSLISVVMDGAQWNAASDGLKGWQRKTNGVPVEWSFCAQSVRTGQPFIVENATVDPIVQDNPLVDFENIRCYAGAPLVTKNGHVVGNFCVVGEDSRNFSESEIERLKSYAKEAIQRIEARAASLN